MLLKRSVLFAFLAGLLVFAACQKRPQLQFPNEVRLMLQKAPQQAISLGYLNMAQVRESPLFQFILSEILQEPEIAKAWNMVADSLNFQIEKDLHSIFFFFTQDSIQTKNPPFLVVQGNFDPPRISRAITSEDTSGQWVSELFAGYSLHTFADQVSFTFQGSSVLLLGNPELLKNWLQGPADSTRQIPEMLKAIHYKDGSWMAIDFEKLPPHFIAGLDSGKAVVLQKIKRFSISSRFRQDLQVSGELRCASREDARLFRDLVKGALAGIKLNFAGDRQLIDTINRIRLDEAGVSLLFSFKYKKKDLERLLAARKEAVQTLNERLKGLPR